MTALERYKSIMDECRKEEPEPIERLRFFLSLALTGQDWLDVEQFIDGVSQQLAECENRVKDECAALCYEQNWLIHGEEMAALILATKEEVK